MIWILVVIGFLILLVAAFLVLTRLGTVYVSHANGFSGCGSGQSTVRTISRTELRPAFDRLLKDDRFDHLFFSSSKDQDEGFSIGKHFEGGYEISSTFSLTEEALREGTFRQVMETLQLPLLEDQIFNEGMGALEARALSYRIPSDPAQMVKITRRLIDSFYPQLGLEICIDAYMIRNGPGSGVSFKRNVDLLEGIL